MKIVLRTEGNHAVGMGDVWRCIGLADEFAKQRDKVLFILSGGEEAISTVQKKGYPLQTAACFNEERRLLQEFDPDVIVVNKLNSPPEYVRSLKELKSLIVTLDDAGEGAQYSDIRINAIFKIEDAIIDQRYIPLRDEFQEFHQQEKIIRNQVQELLVTQGGSDTYGFTPMIVKALDRMRFQPHCTVVTGPAFRHQAELDAAASDSALNLTLVDNTDHMAQLMWDADLAITAGGITMFELAAVGTPSLVIGGERWDAETAAELREAGAVRYLGFGADVDYDLLPQEVDALAADLEARTEMSSIAKQSVDGRGSERTVNLIRERVHRLEKVRR